MVDEELKELKHYRRVGKVIEIVGIAMLMIAFFIIAGITGTIEYETGKAVQTITLKMYIFFTVLGAILGIAGVVLVNFSYKLRKYVHNQIKRHITK